MMAGRTDVKTKGKSLGFKTFRFVSFWQNGGSHDIENLFVNPLDRSIDGILDFSVMVKMFIINVAIEWVGDVRYVGHVFPTKHFHFSYS